MSKKTTISIKCNLCSVGSEEFSEWDWQKIDFSAYDWIVYSYQSGSYDGDGVAIAKLKGKEEYLYGSLSHCSCFGPTENFGSGKKMDKKDVLRLLIEENGIPRQDTDYDFAHWQAVGKKVKQLIKQANLITDKE